MLPTGIKASVTLLTAIVFLFITCSSPIISYVKDPKSFPMVWSSQDETDKYNQQSEKKYEGLLRCQKVRLERLHNRCEELGLSSDKKLEDYSEIELQSMTGKFISDDVNRLVLKALPKTGCTSWKTLLINNTMAFKPWQERHPGAHRFDAIQNLAGLYSLNSFTKEALLNRLYNYIIVLTVRHPLLRLESAFRDKEIHKYNEQIRKDPQHFYNVTVVDIFQRWIDVLSSGEHGNRHYDTYMNHAHPCIIPFNYIAKTETANPEMEYIVREKLKGIGGPVQKNRSNKLESEHDTPPKLKLLELISRLKDPEATVKALMTEYGNDMKLFGYDVETHDGKIYATCESYEFDGMCC